MRGQGWAAERACVGSSPPRWPTRSPGCCPRRCWPSPSVSTSSSAGVSAAVRRPRLTMFTGWLLVSAVVFSYMSGMVHPYYTVAMAPAVAGLVGIGAVWAWRNRSGWDGRTVLAAMISLTAVWSAMLLHRNALWPSMGSVGIDRGCTRRSHRGARTRTTPDRRSRRQRSECWPRSVAQRHSRSPPPRRRTTARSRPR